MRRSSYGSYNGINYVPYFNRDERRMKMYKRRRRYNMIANIIKYVGAFILVVSVLLFISVPGHADMMIEMEGVDDWSTFDYIFHLMISIISGGTGYILYYVGDFMLNS